MLSRSLLFRVRHGKFPKLFAVRIRTLISHNPLGKTGTLFFTS